MPIKILLSALFLFPVIIQAQEESRDHFGDRLIIGMNYGFSEDFVGDRSNRYEISHFTSLKTGVSLTKQVYAGLQTRFVRARNFETPSQNFYMAGAWARWYLRHPALPKSSIRFGAFLESGFMLGNYAYDYRNDATYSFERSGSWYIPIMLGAEYRVWRNLTLEGGLNFYYNNGGSWDKQGIAHFSLGANWHI